MSVRLSPNLPANVVEIGVEISQAKLDAINNGSAPASGNPFVTVSYLTSTLTPYATQSYVTGLGYLTDAPSNGNEYVRKNAAWAIATGGGGGGVPEAPVDGNLYARQNAGWTSFTIPTLSVTNIDLTGNFNGYSMGSGYYTFKFDSTANTLRMQDGTGSGITISPTGITFPDSRVLSNSPAKLVNTLTGAYTLALSDTNNIIYSDSTAGGGMPYTISIPEDSTTDFTIGTVITFVANAGAGADITFAPTGMGSPTIYGTTFYVGGTIHQAFLTKVAANTWIIK